MDSSAANRIPDEIISEILTPLLKHSDEVFRDQSEKPLLDPDDSASRYLLVCKPWLRVSTPLLYNVVILRTTAQAEALQAVLKTDKEFGLFIKKLRVEGGFGNAMHIILKCASNITDLYMTLFIAGTDSVKGLCSGLPFVNPQRVIIVDACAGHLLIQPKKNKKITELLETLVSLIPKWDKLRTFQFPYLAGFEGVTDPILDPRAAALTSALAKSASLETLIVGLGNSFPAYLHQMVDASNLKSIDFTVFPHAEGTAVAWGLPLIREAVNGDAKLKALVSCHDIEDAEQGELEDEDSEDDIMSLPTTRSTKVNHRGKYIKLKTDEHGNYFCPTTSLAYADSLQELKKLGKTIGGSVKQLHVPLWEAKSNSIDLTPFASLVYLNWYGDINL
ncbi:hypothetical protein C8R45DRAFT_522218 [Mycena sanguinolenta]|nr:hypothetical protein C8R45DRAFT_522218 [Mycena sanguinolenta]